MMEADIFFFRQEEGILRRHLSSLHSFFFFFFWSLLRTYLMYTSRPPKPMNKVCALSCVLCENRYLRSKMTGTKVLCVAYPINIFYTSAQLGASSLFLLLLSE